MQHPIRAAYQTLAHTRPSATRSPTLITALHGDITLRAQSIEQRLLVTQTLGALHDIATFLREVELDLPAIYDIEQDCKAKLADPEQRKKVRLVRAACRAWQSAFTRLAKRLGLARKK